MIGRFSNWTNHILWLVDSHVDQIVLSDWLVHMWNKSHSLIDVKSYYDELTFVIMLRVLCLPARKKMQVGTASSWTSSLWMALPVVCWRFLPVVCVVVSVVCRRLWMYLWFVQVPVACGCVCDLLRDVWFVDVVVICRWLCLWFADAIVDVLVVSTWLSTYGLYMVVKHVCTWLSNMLFAQVVLLGSTCLHPCGV